MSVNPESLNNLNKILGKTNISEELIQLHAEDLKNQEADLPKSWVEKGHPIGNLNGKDTVGLRLLGLLAGDGFIKKTPYEGYTAIGSLSYFKKFSEDLVAKAETNQDDLQFMQPHMDSVREFRDEVGKSLTIAEKINNIQGQGYGLSKEERTNLINDYAASLQKDFKEKSGWFPFGWTTRNGDSHAMMLHIDMAAGRIIIVNSGGGIQNHAAVKTNVIDPLTGNFKDETRIQEFLAISDIDKNRLDNIDFFKFLIEMQVTGAWKGSLEIDDKNIYEVLPGYLKGRIEPGLNPFVHPEAFKKPQKSGTCAIKSVTTMFYYMMVGSFKEDSSQLKERIGCFKRMKFLSQTRALLSCVSSNMLTFEAQEIRLCRDIIGKLNRDIEKLRRENLITEKEIEELLITFADLEARFQNASLDIAQRSNELESVSCLLTSAIPDTLAKIEVQKDLVGNLGGWTGVQASGKNESQSNIDIDVSLDKLNKINFVIDQTGVNTLNDLKSAGNIFSKVYNTVYKNIDYGTSLDYKNKMRTHMLNKFAELISQIPDPSRNEGTFWNTVPEDQILAYMEQNYSLMVQLQNINFINGKNHEADVTAMHYVLYAINVQLARRLKETRLEGRTVNYIDLIYEMRSPYFVIKNPVLQRKLDSVLKYFDPNFDLTHLTKKDDEALFEKESNVLFSFKTIVDYSKEVKIGQIDEELSNLERNETLKYYKEFLDDKATKEKLFSKGKLKQKIELFGVKEIPLDETHSKAQQLQVLIHQDENTPRNDHILPASVYYLQDAALLTLTHHYANVSRYTKPTQITGKFEVDPYNSSAKTIELVCGIYEKDGVINRSDFTSKNLQLSNYDITETNLVTQYQNHEDQLISHYKNRIKQNRLILNQNSSYGIEFDAVHELEMIGVDPFDAVVRTISFAERHVFALKREEIQKILPIHLFGHGRLLSQLEDNPAIVTKMAEFFKKAINHYQQENDLDTCMYLAKLGHDLKKFIKNSGCEDTLPDFRSIILNDLYPQFLDSWDDKQQIFATLVMFYENCNIDDFRKDPVLMRQLSEDIIALRLCDSMVGRQRNDYRSAYSIQNLFEDLIDDALKDNEMMNKILNHVVAIVDPLSIKFEDSRKWVCTRTDNYECDNYRIDIYNGHVEDKFIGQSVRLPRDVLTDRNFQKIFKEKVENPKAQSVFNAFGSNVGSVYTINDGTKDKLVIKVPYRREPIFEKMIDGKKYRYFSGINQISGLSPSLLEDENEYWLNENNPAHIIARKNGKTIFTMFIDESDNDKYDVKKVEKVDSNGNLLRLVPIDVVDHKFKPLTEIVDSREIQFWVSEKTGKLSEVFCKTAGLSFIAKGKDKDRLYSEQYPGYYLVENPDVFLLDSLKYLTLENANQERKILLPKAPLDSQFEGKSLLRKVIQRIPPLNVSWNEFELHEDTLVAKTIEGQFYQVAINISKGNYEDAFTLLEKVVGLDRFLDSKAKNNFELKTIFGLLQLIAKDHHPAANALILRLILKVGVNKFKFPMMVGVEDPAKFDINILAKFYYDYNNNLANATQYRLSESEEKKISSIIEVELENAKKKFANQMGPNLDMLPDFLKDWVVGRFFDLNIGQLLQKVFCLNNGVGLLGTRTVTLMKAELLPKVEILGLETVKDKFQGFDVNMVVDVGDYLGSDLIKESEYFDSSYTFVNLYWIARQGTNENREELLRMLELNGSINSPSLEVLKKVCLNPDRFPTFRQLHEADEKYKDLEIKYKEALENSQAADRAMWRETMWGTPQRAASKKVCEELEDIRKKIGAEVAEAKTARDELYRNIGDGDSYFAKGIKLIKIVCKIAWTYLFGEFSITTAIYDQFYSLFRQKHYFNQKNKIENPNAVSFEGQDLAELDLAYNDYFDTLVNQYFETDKKDVDKIWEKDPEGYRLPEAHSNEVLQKKLEAENTELDKFRATLAKQEFVYQIKPTLKSKKAFAGMRKSLVTTSQTLKTRLKTQKEALLWQINHIPGNAENKTVKKLQKNALNKQLVWDDIKRLTLEGSIEAFQKQTELGEDEIKRLMMGVSDYLIKSTRLQQMEKAITAVQKVEKELAKSDQNLKKIELLTQDVAVTLKLMRAYTPDSNNIHRQWFELASQYMYRKIQLEKIDEILGQESLELLAEMPTGFGKTKTMIPSLIFEKTKEGYLVLSTWPGSLEMTNTTDVMDQMDKGFGRPVDRIVFSRASQIDTVSIKFIYNNLIENKEKGIPVNIRSEALRSLELHYLMLLQQVSNPKITENAKFEPAKMHEQIGYFAKILRLIRTSGWTTIDEGHVTLDPKDTLIYTFGDYELLPVEHIELIEKMFLEMTSEELEPMVKISQNQQHMMKDSEMDQLLVTMAEKMRVYLGISEDNKESYENFVLGKKGDIPDWIVNDPKKNLIALVKGQLTQVLKSSLRSAVDENYGLSKLHINKKEYAISYASSNTPKENESNPSQFKNPHETWNKTYMVYLHKGLMPFQVRKLIENLKTQAIEECKEGAPIENTEACKFFQSIVKNEKIMIRKLSEKQIEELIPLFQRNKAAIFRYMRTVIVNQLKIYPKNLVSTVHNFRSQFASSLSLTATPQQEAAHGPDTQFVPMAGTSGQITHLLLTKCKDPKTLHMIDELKPAEVLDKALDIVQGNSKIHAMIDIGALYKGLTNLQVAQKIREKFKGQDDTQGVLFFDEKEGLFKIMDVETGQIQDLSEMDMDPEQRQTFYDQSRCFGSDIVQDIDALGLMLAGKDTTKADAGQAAGRMRKLKDKQSVEILLQRALNEEIFGTEEVSIKKLLVYWISNQMKLDAEKNYQSQLQQMDNEIRRPLLDKLLGLEIGKPLKIEDEKVEVDVPGIISFFDQVKDEFFNDEDISPWEMYAPIPEDKDTKECLKNAKTDCETRTSKITALSQSEKEHITTRLNGYSEKWTNMPLPEKVKAVPSGMGMECEVLQEVEVENEVEQEVMVYEDLIERKPKEWSKNLDLFQDEWFVPQELNTFMNKIGKGFDLLTNWLPSGEILRPVSMVGMAIVAGSLVSIALAIASVAQPIIVSVGAIVAGVYLMLEFGPNLIRMFVKPAMVYRMTDVMNDSLPDKVSTGSQFFNPNLLVSENYYVRSPLGLGEEVQQVFSNEKKPTFKVLVIQDESESGVKSLKMMVIDQNDSVFFRRKLKEDKEKTAEDVKGRKRKIALYDVLSNQISCQGKNAFEENELENNKQFQELLMNAKFMNGEINYSETELDIIRDSTRRPGIGIIGEMFENHILKVRPVNKTYVRDKEIGKMLALGV